MFIQVMLSLLSSLIFYLFVVYFPQKKSRFNTKEFVINSYNDVTIKIIYEIFSVLKKQVNHKVIKNHSKDYKYMRSQITDQDMNTLRNLDEKKMLTLAKEINYHLIQLKNWFYFELSQDYLKEDKAANERLRYFIIWVDQFGYTMNNIDFDHEYYKWFCRAIDEQFRGTSDNGEKDVDDFNVLIENAYQKSLITHKLLQLFKAPFCIITRWALKYLF